MQRRSCHVLAARPIASIGPFSQSVVNERWIEFGELRLGEFDGAVAARKRRADL
jgi:hypothetical protein